MIQSLPEKHLICGEDWLPQMILKGVDCSDGAKAVATDEYRVSLARYTGDGPFIQFRRRNFLESTGWCHAHGGEHVKASCLEVVLSFRVQRFSKPGWMNKNHPACPHKP